MIASLLGVFLAPALANRNGKRHHSEHSHRSFPDTGVSTDSKEGSKDWKSVWDIETGYVATKVLSKHIRTIAKIDKRFFFDKPFPAPPRGHQIVTTVLLGLLLTPALAEYFPQKGGSQPIITKQFTIVGGFQILTLNREWRVATIEQRSNQGSWKTIWNYNLGYIASRVLSQGTCYISVMNRNVIPRFDTLITLAEQNMGLRGQGQPAREITFVVKGPVLDLSSYGTDIMAMCRGLTTYLTYEVYGPQNTYNYGSCTVLDVLQLVDLKYCQANNKGPIQGYQPF